VVTTKDVGNVQPYAPYATALQMPGGALERCTCQIGFESGIILIRFAFKMRRIGCRIR
jgi:hypothetical protein